MKMFETFLNSIPKNRYEMVSDLEIPDVTLSPYIWDPYYYPLTRSESILSNMDDYEMRTLSSASSLPLSRAMTDSEIDYEMFRRYKNRSLSDPWSHMRAAHSSFPPGYLESLYRYRDLYDDVLVESALPTSTYESIRRHNEELRLKMQRYFDECRVFTPYDPGLEALEDALRTVDMQKIIDYELDNITPLYNNLYRYKSWNGSTPW